VISRALLNAPFFIPKDADLLRNRKVNTKKRQNRHLPELAFLILGTYFTAPFFSLFFCLENCYNMIQRNGFLCDTQKALSFILDRRRRHESVI
jgi:hypothetical protein